jgi:hypothetical protein
VLNDLSKVPEATKHNGTAPTHMSQRCNGDIELQLRQLSQASVPSALVAGRLITRFAQGELYRGCTNVLYLPAMSLRPSRDPDHLRRRQPRRAPVSRLDPNP